MKPTKLFLALAVAVTCIPIFAGCKPTNGEQMKEKVYSLHHKAYDIRLMDDVQIAVSDSFVVLVSAFFEDGICRTYSITDGMKHCRAFGRIGDGVDEFRQPVLTYAAGNTFGINDINEMSLTVIGIDDDGTMNITDRLKATYQRAKAGEDITPKDTRYTLLPRTNHYVSVFLKDSASMFTLSGSFLQAISRFGESPVDGHLSWYGMRNGLNGHMATSGKTFFYATENLPYLTAYRLKGDTMKKMWDVFYRTPHYTVSNDAIRYDKGKATGPLKSLCADERYVYLLYVDELLSRYDSNDIAKSCSNKILVFSHSGEYAATLQLDCYLKKIAVDGRRGKLYGIARMPHHTLVEFDLPHDFANSVNAESNAKSQEIMQLEECETVEIGDTLPRITLYDTLGNTRYLQELKGKYLLLDFWSANCGPCKASIPELKRIADTMGDKVEVVSISCDAGSVWKMASAEHGLDWHNLNDLKGREQDGICSRYNVTSYPSFFIISPEGVVLDKLKGYGEDVVMYFVKKNVK